EVEERENHYENNETRSPKARAANLPDSQIEAYPDVEWRKHVIQSRRG
ncbi:MAG: hypothetical protein Athens041674_850, partial [Parcubacteria group bacterium Athens0416_74]